MMWQSGIESTICFVKPQSHMKLNFELSSANNILNRNTKTWNNSGHMSYET